MAPLNRKLLDTTTARGKHIAGRLKKEVVIWLATTGPDGRPLVVPVWFLFEGDTFLIYSLPGQKERNVRRNPNVSLHLNSTPEGDDIVRVAGTAQVAKRQPPAYKVPGYVRKYGSWIKNLDMTAESFSAEYKIPIRIRATRFYGGE